MPENSEQSRSAGQTGNENGKRTLTPDQMRELARKLYDMLRRDLEIERDRKGK